MRFLLLNPKPVVFIFVILLFSFSPGNLFAWGDEGHRIVARIAAANLTPKARGQIAVLLQNEKCSGISTTADRLACASTWADAVRYARYPETYNWHFVDISLNFDNYDHGRDCEENSAKGDCGIPALENLQRFLKNESVSPKYSKYSRTNALKFIIHSVGDLHQPLHTVREEVGGNFFFVKYDNSAGGKEISCYNPDNNKDFFAAREKLHKIWDTCILTQPLKTMSLTKYARNLNNAISSAEKNEYETGSATDWLLETHQTAINSSYKNLPKGTHSGINRYSTIPGDYFETNKSVVEKQLQRAGIRLAKILNDAFAD